MFLDIVEDFDLGKAWTKQEDDILQRLADKRVTTAVCAEKLGRTIPAVVKRRACLGIRISAKDYPWSEEDDARLIEYTQNRVPRKIIALKLNRTVDALSNRRGRLDIREPQVLRHKWTQMWVPREVLSVCNKQAYAAGIRPSEFVRQIIMKHMGVTISATECRRSGSNRSGRACKNVRDKILARKNRENAGSGNGQETHA